MSTTVTAPTSPVRAPAMQVRIAGKIQAIRRFDNTTFTRIVTPAPDSYSRPQVVEVRSKNKLGERDDEITITAQLGGYTRKAYPVIDKDTGEKTMVTPTDMTLDVIDE